MGSFHSIQLKRRTFEMLPEAKEEFMRHHPEFDMSMLSNDKIIFETVKFYLAVEYGKKRGSR